MEEMLVGILAEGASERKGASALSAISRYFVDWNEVRVSAACEIASAMPELAGAVDKAALVRSVLAADLRPLERDDARLPQGARARPTRRS